MNPRPYRAENRNGRVVIVDANGRDAPPEHQPPAHLGPGMQRETALETITLLNREPARLPEFGPGESRR